MQRKLDEILQALPPAPTTRSSDSRKPPTVSSPRSTRSTSTYAPTPSPLPPIHDRTAIRTGRRIIGAAGTVGSSTARHEQNRSTEHGCSAENRPHSPGL